MTGVISILISAPGSGEAGEMVGVQGFMTLIESCFDVVNVSESLYSASTVNEKTPTVVGVPVMAPEPPSRVRPGAGLPPGMQLESGWQFMYQETCPSAPLVWSCAE